MGDITVTDSAHPSHLVEELVALRSAGELFDYVIKGTKASFHFHSLVLALVSPVFRAMLRSEMSESAWKEVTFPTIPDNIMAKVIDYTYNGTCSLSRDHLVDLVKAAHYLQMSKLLKMCEEQISTVLRPTNCIPWLQLADKLHLTNIMPRIHKMMQTSYHEIITTTDFKELEKPELLQYLADVREYDACSDGVLNGALIWVKHDSENRLADLEDLLREVHISKCSDNVLSKMMDDYSDLFNKQQSMYRWILSEVLRKPMAHGKLHDDGKTIIIIGGQSFSDVSNTDCWTLQNDQMVKFSEFNTDAKLNSYHSICQIPGGFMVTGGNYSDLCVIFVLSMKMWVKQQSLLTSRSYHVSCFCSNKVFLMGGYTGLLRTTSSVDFMDIEKKTWSNGAKLPKAACLLKAVNFKSKLFVMYPGTRNCNFYQLDRDEKSWLQKTALPSSGDGCSLAASDDKIFAAGGDKNINYMYTPTTDSWCQLTGPSLQERHGALVHHQQILYLFPGSKRDKILTNVEEYDISADKWSLTKWKMPTPLWLHGTFLVDLPK